MLTQHPRTGVPESTQKAARNLPKEEFIYIALHDELDMIFSDEDFADLFSHTGQPAVAPWRLALLLMVQYLEGWSDRQTMKEAASKIDIKYLLELEVDVKMPNFSVLCKFRERLIEGDAVNRVLEKILAHLAAKGVKRNRKRLRTDSTRIHMAARDCSRLEAAHEALYQALVELIEIDQQWIGEHLPVGWVERYGEHLNGYGGWRSDLDRADQLQQIAEDGMHVLEWLNEASAPDVSANRMLQHMRLMWIQQFTIEDEQVVVRTKKDLPPCAQRIISVHDPDARAGADQSGTIHYGYKGHFTETVSDDPKEVNLIVNVETTSVTTPDEAIMPKLLHTLDDHQQHLVDAGYTSTDVLKLAQDYGIDLIGRFNATPHSKLPRAVFDINWEAKVVTCPEGEQNRGWSTRTDEKGRIIHQANFAKASCDACPQRPACTTSKTTGRSLKFYDRDRDALLLAARHRQTTDAFKALYRQRAGIEGTISQLVRSTFLRTSRYIGEMKTHLHNTLAASAINVSRWFQHFRGQERAQTRITPMKAMAR